MSRGQSQGAGRASSFWRLQGRIHFLASCSFQRLPHSSAHGPFALAQEADLECSTWARLPLASSYALPLGGTCERWEERKKGRQGLYSPPRPIPLRSCSPSLPW